MPYGTLKADTLTYYTATGDVNLAISGIAISGSPLISGVSGVFTTSVSGATVTGNAGQFTTITGGTAQFTNITGVSGTFTSRISGATVTGTSGQFATLTATTGVFTTSISGATISGDVGLFTTISGSQGVFNSGLSVPSGTAASPSISFNGDPNTGLYSTGADALALSTNGTGRLFVNNLGDIETVGSSNWNFAGLAIRRTSSNTADSKVISFLLDGDTRNNTNLYSNVNFVLRTDSAPTTGSTSSGLNAGLEITSPATIRFGTNGSERLRITSAGLVGIGTSVPSYALSVKGGSATSQNLLLTWDTDQTNAYARIRSQFAEGNTSCASEIRFHQRQAQQDGGYQTFWTTNSGGTLVEAMRIDSSQRVGIGTTSPLNLLSVGGNPPASGGLGVVNAGISLALSDNTTSSLYVRHALGGALLGTDGGGQIRFATNGNAVSDEKVRIDSSGRLLVGTSSDFDGYLHQVSSTSGALLSLRRTNSNPGSIKLSSGASGDNVGNGSNLGYLRWYGFHTSADYEAARISAEVDGTPGANDMPGRLVFSTTADGASSPTERVRITNDGYLRLAGKGIQFNGDTADANSLDDYEEGTWTPTLTTSGTDFTSVTYLSNSGGYTKIGNTVIAWFFMYTDAVTIGSASGNVQLGGLPFTVNSSASSRSSGALQNVSGWTAGNMPEAVGHINGGTKLEIYKRTTAGGAQTRLVPSDVSTGSASNSMHGVFIYRI